MSLQTSAALSYGLSTTIWQPPSGWVDVSISKVRRHEAEVLASRTPRSLEDVERSLLETALAWFDAERANLVKAVEWAYQVEAWSLVYELAVRLVRYFEFRAAWSEWQDTYELALKATRNSGDRLREAMILLMLGSVCRRQCRWQTQSRGTGPAERFRRELGIALLKPLPSTAWR